MSLCFVDEGNSEKKSPVKLEIDRPNDFKFHLAYEVYSKAWENNQSDDARSKLNELISALSGNQDGFQDFYAQVQQYRDGAGAFGSGRMRIETSRKRSWQREQNRAGRDRRHR
jgi:hypothetical protein